MPRGSLAGHARPRSTSRAADSTVPRSCRSVRATIERPTCCAASPVTGAVASPLLFGSCLLALTLASTSPQPHHLQRSVDSAYIESQRSPLSSPWSFTSFSSGKSGRTVIADLEPQVKRTTVDDGVPPPYELAVVAATLRAPRAVLEKAQLECSFAARSATTSHCCSVRSVSPMVLMVAFMIDAIWARSNPRRRSSSRVATSRVVRV